MPTYLPWLDLLRFVACVLVIISHIKPASGAGLLGFTGVGLFFSISGFLIGSILVNNRGKPAWVTTFYANRLMRIYPALLVALVFYGGLVAAGFGTQPGMWEKFRANIPHYLTFTAHLSPDAGEPYGIVWTLCVEEYFYLLLPLLFWAFGPKGTAVFLVGVMALILDPRLFLLPGTQQFGTWFLLPMNLLSGAVLAVFRPQPRFGAPWAGIIGMGLVLANGHYGWYHPFGPIMGAVTTLVVWSFAVTPTGVPRVLWPATVAGKWSYGIYLFHLPFCSAALLLARKAGLGEADGLAYFTPAVVMATVGAAVMAGVMYHLWERPILTHRSWVNRRPWARNLAAGIQVSLVPAGVLYWLANGGWW